MLVQSNAACSQFYNSNTQFLSSMFINVFTQLCMLKTNKSNEMQYVYMASIGMEFQLQGRCSAQRKQMEFCGNIALREGEIQYDGHVPNQSGHNGYG